MLAELVILTYRLIVTNQLCLRMVRQHPRPMFAPFILWSCYFPLDHTIRGHWYGDISRKAFLVMFKGMR